MAPWLLGLLGCQVLYEPSCTTLLRLSYKAPKLYGSLAAWPFGLSGFLWTELYGPFEYELQGSFETELQGS